VDCRFNDVVARLPGGRHPFIKLGNPRAVISVGLIFYLFSDGMELVFRVQPFEAVTNKPENRIHASRIDADDHHAR
jgi:hypothetical protein